MENDGRMTKRKEKKLRKRGGGNEDKGGKREEKKIVKNGFGVGVRELNQQPSSWKHTN